MKIWKCWTKNETYFTRARTIKEASDFARTQFSGKSHSVREATAEEAAQWSAR